MITWLIPVLVVPVFWVPGRVAPQPVAPPAVKTVPFHIRTWEA